MDISRLRHPTEKLYRTLCLAIGALIWAILLISTKFFALVFLIPLAIVLWISEKFFQASIFGNAVHVNDHQFSKLNQIANEVSNKLALRKRPEMFVLNSEGLTNALAVKFLSGKYTLLFSNLIDLLWKGDEKEDTIKFVIAHEQAHHAAGHVNFWINLVIKPAMLIPFLGAAYSRACELTCDRIAAEIVQDHQASSVALVSLASGSKELIPQTDHSAFIAQENKVPSFFGFLQEIISSHPRMTKRLIALKKYGTRKETKVDNTVDPITAV